MWDFIGECNSLHYCTKTEFDIDGNTMALGATNYEMFGYYLLTNRDKKNLIKVFEFKDGFMELI